VLAAVGVFILRFFKDVIRFYETELSIHKPKTLAPKNFRDFLKNVLCCPYSVLVWPI